jgi:hypothetical protein
MQSAQGAACWRWAAQGIETSICHVALIANFTKFVIKPKYTEKLGT